MINSDKEVQLKNIIKKYFNGTASKEEIDFLNLYYEGFEQNADVLQNKSADEVSALKTEMEVNIMNRVFADKNKEDAKIVSFSSNTFYKVAVAASIILIAGFAFYLLKPTASTQVAQNKSIQKEIKNDVAPGGNKAVLTLANGTHIILDSAQNGMLTSQGNIKIIKLDDGQLSYQPSTQNDQYPAVQYNTITTPKGGQYQVILSDGTKVWLNAASSLRFPNVFEGDDRKVELTGEGYFEVAHNESKPFHVSVADMEVKVLGTHFNVNAYEDEGEIRTTLLQGSVKVNRGNSAVVIKPNQQSVLNISNGTLKINNNVDLDEVMAWKNGFFYFNKAGVKTVMSQLARWYDVEVVYKGIIPERQFEGEIQRTLSLAQALKLLSQNHINFKIEGRQLIVKP